MTEPIKKPLGTFVLHDLFGRVAKVTDWITGCPGKTTPLRMGVWPLTEERPFTDLVLFGLSELYYVVTSDDGEVTEVTALPVRPDKVIATKQGKFRLEALLREEPDYLHRLPEALPVTRFDRSDRLLRPDGYVVLNLNRTEKTSPYLFKAGSAYGLYGDTLVQDKLNVSSVGYTVAKMHKTRSSVELTEFHLDWDGPLVPEQEKSETQSTPKGSSS